MLSLSVLLLVSPMFLASLLLLASNSYIHPNNDLHHVEKQSDLVNKFSLKRVWHEIFDFFSQLGPWVSHSGRFEFLRKFAEMFATWCLSLVSTARAISWSPVSITVHRRLFIVGFDETLTTKSACLHLKVNIIWVQTATQQHLKEIWKNFFSQKIVHCRCRLTFTFDYLREFS
jgi:hypothetical protein